MVSPRGDLIIIMSHPIDGFLIASLQGDDQRCDGAQRQKQAAPGTHDTFSPGSYNGGGYQAPKGLGRGC